MPVPELQGHSCPSASGSQQSPHTLTQHAVPAWSLFPFYFPAEDPHPSSTSSPLAVPWAGLEDAEHACSAWPSAAKEETLSAKWLGARGCFSEALCQGPRSRPRQAGDLALPAHGCPPPFPSPCRALPARCQALLPRRSRPAPAMLHGACPTPHPLSPAELAAWLRGWRLLPVGSIPDSTWGGRWSAPTLQPSHTALSARACSTCCWCMGHVRSTSFHNADTSRSSCRDTAAYRISLSPWDFPSAPRSCSSPLAAGQHCFVPERPGALKAGRDPQLVANVAQRSYSTLMAPAQNQSAVAGGRPGGEKR